jgi:hypothetical protein
MKISRLSKFNLAFVVSALTFGLYATHTFAQSCPEKTIVNSPTSITFVGGVADLGGDTQSYVWFEYGTSSGNYSFKTERKVLDRTGKYCITVDNLNPCTTYYYRAAMENKAGPSYGAELKINTLCQGQNGKVLGVATEIPTGNIKSIFFDYLIFPLLFSIFVVLGFRSHIFKWEEYLQRRREEYQRFKAEKTLRKKIEEIRIKEKFPELYE